MTQTSTTTPATTTMTMTPAPGTTTPTTTTTTTPTSTTSRPKPDECVPSSIPDDTSCFLLNTTQVSWVGAESTCVSYGGHLASINSDDDSIFLGSSVAAGNDVWIGAFSRKIDE